MKAFADTLRAIDAARCGRAATDTMVRDDGARFAWLVSHADEPVTVKPAVAAGLSLTALDGSPVGAEVTMAPFGVSVFRLTGTGTAAQTSP